DRNIGVVLRAVGKPVDAMAAFERARATLERLTEAHPAVTQLQSYLAASHESIGILLARSGQTPRALAAYAKALAIRQGLAEANPSVLVHEREVAYCRLDLGWLLYMSGRLAEAQAAFERALPIYERMVGVSGTAPNDQASLANLWVNIGLVRTDTGDTAG